MQGHDELQHQLAHLGWQDLFSGKHVSKNSKTGIDGRRSWASLWGCGIECHPKTVTFNELCVRFLQGPRTWNCRKSGICQTKTSILFWVIGGFWSFFPKPGTKRHLVLQKHREEYRNDQIHNFCLRKGLADVGSVILFLLPAMGIVESIDSWQIFGSQFQSNGWNILGMLQKAEDHLEGFAIVTSFMVRHTKDKAGWESYNLPIRSQIGNLQGWSRARRIAWCLWSASWPSFWATWRKEHGETHNKFNLLHAWRHGVPFLAY